MDALVRQSPGEAKSLVGFVVGKVCYAIDILRVQEVINPLPVVSLPEAPPTVLGVANHRGEVLPVIELRRRFGLASEDQTRRTKWVIVRSHDRSIGLVVDAITDVFGVEEEEERRVPDLGRRDHVRSISTVYSREEGLVFVVDVDHVASSLESVDLGPMAEVLEKESASDT